MEQSKTIIAELVPRECEAKSDLPTEQEQPRELIPYDNEAEDITHRITVTDLDLLGTTKQKTFLFKAVVVQAAMCVVLVGLSYAVGRFNPPLWESVVAYIKTSVTSV
ncbi:MAG: hypothetical protein LBN40_06135 [Oscillospiraceae bacterium]|nr:hypothetical protein [Oscillospiraceae bacterium]